MRTKKQKQNILNKRQNKQGQLQKINKKLKINFGNNLMSYKTNTNKYKEYIVYKF